MAVIDQTVASPGDARVERFGPDGATELRSRAGRGTLINAVFMIGATGLALIQGVVVARLLPTSVLGQWGLLMAAFMTLIMLGSVGIDDKFIQQDDRDQQRAFEIAFTLQLALGGVFVLVVLAGMPLFALLYGRTQLIGPGLALAAVIPALALQMPLWVHYRRMDFARQRILQTVDPVVTFVATIGLLIAGVGLWGLVLGAMAGSWAAALLMVRTSPYPLHLRWDRDALHEYSRFSWPLLVAAMSTILLIQVPVAISARTFGLAAVAGLALAGSIAGFTTNVDALVSQALYPAVCAVKDRADLLFETFWKSNRLALLWAVPIGSAGALFAGDFVHYVVGEKFRFAVPLIALYCVNAALNQIAFNWTVYFRALGQTRPVAAGNLIDLAAVLVIAVPLLLTEGLTGFAAGMTVATVIAICVRMTFLRRIFPALAMLRHVARGVVPTLPALVAVLLEQTISPGDRSPARVVAEVVAFASLAAGSALLAEGALLREAFGYLRRRQRNTAPVDRELALDAA